MTHKPTTVDEKHDEILCCECVHKDIIERARAEERERVATAIMAHREAVRDMVPDDKPDAIAALNEAAKIARRTLINNPPREV